MLSRSPEAFQREPCTHWVALQRRLIGKYAQGEAREEKREKREERKEKREAGGISKGESPVPPRVELNDTAESTGKRVHLDGFLDSGAVVGVATVLDALGDLPQPFDVLVGQRVPHAVCRVRCKCRGHALSLARTGTPHTTTQTLRRPPRDTLSARNNIGAASAAVRTDTERGAPSARGGAGVVITLTRILAGDERLEELPDIGPEGGLHELGVLGHHVGGDVVLGHGGLAAEEKEVGEGLRGVGRVLKKEVDLAEGLRRVVVEVHQSQVVERDGVDLLLQAGGQILQNLRGATTGTYP